MLDGRLLDYEPAVRDQIAARGATFTDFHSESPLCCPARAGYLTGQHTHNHGVYDNDAALFDPTMTIATQLQRAGYWTMLTGKYFNGYKAQRGKNPWLAPNVPPGWNRWSAMGKPAYYDYTLYEDGGAQEAHGSAAADYSTDVIASKAAALIRSAPAGQPLFAWVAPFSAHAPFTPAPRYAGAGCSAADRFWMPPSWNEADVSDKPQWVQDTPLLRGKKGFDVNSLCRDMLGVNDLVQQVVSALADTGRLQNTILIYAGDNGMMSGEHRMTGKTAPYETQVPFYLRWDGVVRAGLCGSPSGCRTSTSPRRCAPSPAATSGRTRTARRAPTGSASRRCCCGLVDAPLAPDRARRAAVRPRPALERREHPVLGGDHHHRLVAAGPAGLRRGGDRRLPLAPDRGHRDRRAGAVRRVERAVLAWTPGSAGDPCELHNLAGDPSYQGELDALLTAEVSMASEQGVGH